MRSPAYPPGSDRASLMNASAVGYYGDTGDTAAVDEESPPGSGFFAELSEAWEAASIPAADAGVRVIRTRTGLVLDAGGGLMRPSYRHWLFAGGPLAGGRRWMPWISMADLGRRGALHHRPR